MTGELIKRKDIMKDLSARSLNSAVLRNELHVSEASNKYLQSKETTILKYIQGPGLKFIFLLFALR